MLRRVSGACGIASQLVLLIVIVVVISNSPWFSWAEKGISVLGVGGSKALLFNWGLILTGLLSLIFAIGLRKSLPSSLLGKLGITSLLLCSIAISATGIFPRSIDLPHDLASIAFFVLTNMALLLVGVAAVTARQMRWGLMSLTAAVLMVTLQLAPWPWGGGAIKQVVSCLPWSLWTIVFGVELLMKARLVDV